MAVPGMQGLDTLYKPWGMTAGGMVGRRETDMEAADLLNLEEGMLGNVIKQVEASRAANDFSNPEMERWRQAKLMGEGMQQDALGRLKQGTLNTDISAGNQKNQTDTLENQAKAWMTESDMIMSLPDGLAGATSGMQLSPQMQALAQQVGGIDRLKMVLPKINEMLKTQLMNTPKYMGDVSLKGVEHGNTMERVRYEQGETTARNNADNAARSAERADAREDRTMVREGTNERELSAYLANLRNLQETTSKKIKETEKTRDSVSPADFIGYTDQNGKALDAAARSKLAQEVKTQAKADLALLKQKEAEIVQAQEMIFQQSRYYKGPKGNNSAPQPQASAGPKLPPGVSVVGVPPTTQAVAPVQTQPRGFGSGYTPPDLTPKLRYDRIGRPGEVIETR